MPLPELHEQLANEKEIKLSAEDDFANALAQIVNDVWEEKGMPAVINNDFTKGFAKKLWGNVTTGYGKDLSATIDYDSPDTNMLLHLQKNVYQFAGAENYTQMRDLTNALIGEDGKLRSYSDYKNAAFNINAHYAQYRKTEYNTAVAGGQMASKWVDIENSGTKLLQFDAVLDNHTTALCSSLNGVIKPVDDPFWNVYYPPNHFNCRSTVRQLNSGTPTPNEDIVYPEKMPDMFKVNLGKQGLAFPPKHAYWVDLPKDVLLESMKLMPYDAQFELIDKAGKGYVRRHFLVNTKARDYKYLEDIASEKAQQGMKVEIMPTLNESDPLRNIICPDAIGKKNPDLRIDGILWEVKKATVPLNQNNLSRAIRNAVEQAYSVIIVSDIELSYSYMENIAKGRFNTHENLKIIEFRHAGKYKRFDK